VVGEQILFSLGVRVFLSLRRFRGTPYRRLTQAQKKLFGIFLFQHFNGTAQSFS